MEAISRWEMLKETAREWSEDRASRLAAALAYYTIFSLAPLLVIAVAAVSFVLRDNQHAKERVATALSHVGSGWDPNQVAQMIDAGSRHGSGWIAAGISIALVL